MSKMNPLAGLIGYGDSDDDSDDGSPSPTKIAGAHMASNNAYPESPLHPPGVHPAPISHCPWSACYDENSGYTYYWNQQTNAVTWEAPPEYLLALRVAQQQLQTQGFPGTTEVSAEEWQLYQQALADKQGGLKQPPRPSPKPAKVHQKSAVENKSNPKKRRLSEEEEKIELITSYHNSDSESNDESESPLKATQPPPPAKVSKTVKKSKPKPPSMTYGPALPPNQNYSVPIGPEMPPELQKDKSKSPKSPRNRVLNVMSRVEEKTTVIEDSEDSQDENALLSKLKDKAQLLERLGGEIPSELHKIIYDDKQSPNKSQKTKESKQMMDNIDDLLNEIEKKELPKIKSKKGEKSNDVDSKEKDKQDAKSPKSGEISPPSEAKPLFPSIMNISETDTMHVNNETPKDDKNEVVNAAEKRGSNLYLMNTEDFTENTQRKKLRISNSVLPERKRNASPVYTTKYAQSNDGFNNERTGLGFSKEEQDDDSPKNMSGNTISYGNGLTFTKGETLNEENADEDLDELTELVEAKLKYLNQLQPCVITPVQEMLIQMQALAGAFRAGALAAWWWRRRARGGARALARHEAGAAPPGWSLAFQRSEGKYQYRRESDGLLQWEYPAVADTDMDISTTPPHPGIEGKEDPPLPCSPVQAAWRAQTPPPPAWNDPPPPGCDDPLPLPVVNEKREIGDELMSFYNDIAELEKQSSEPPTTCTTPEPPPPPIIVEKDKDIEKEQEKEKEKEELKEKDRQEEREREKRKEKERQKDREAKEKREKEAKANKKKTKVKISTSMGMKHKSVSSLVAKWQQVADEIHSD